jgi:prepilin-type N-terminal cleavage/methylation domain-containing protein
MKIFQQPVRRRTARPGPKTSDHASRFTFHVSRSALRTPHSARAGFTLVEILVAIGILGLVCSAIFSTWTAILRATKVGQDAAATVQRARIVAHVLEDSLTSAQFFTANQQYYSFVADEGSLSFVARLSKSFPRSGKFGDLDVRRITFSIRSGAEGHELVLQQTPLVMEMDEDEKKHPVVLAKNVQKFKAQFWDIREQDWVDEWLNTNQLPPMVKVTLQLTDKPNSMAPPEEITRIVSLPATAVPPMWQVPRGMGGPPGGPPGGLQPPSLGTPPGGFQRPPPGGQGRMGF